MTLRRGLARAALTVMLPSVTTPRMPLPEGESSTTGSWSMPFSCRMATASCSQSESEKNRRRKGQEGEVIASCYRCAAAMSSHVHVYRWPLLTLHVTSGVTVSGEVSWRSPTGREAHQSPSWLLSPRPTPWARSTNPRRHTALRGGEKWRVGKERRRSGEGHIR